MNGYRNLLLVIFVFGCVCFSSCLNPPQYDVVPQITLISATPLTLHQQSDSLTIKFSFTDGDGDLGLSTTETGSNVCLYDSRLANNFCYEYRIPYIEPRGTVKAISGDVSIVVPSITCIPGHVTDTLTYRIQITDRAGHVSNSITTPQIILHCQ